jgi:drug/metabolite transporter (DMT)-like permease
MKQNVAIGISWIISRTFIMATIMAIARILGEGGMINYAIMFWQNAFAFVFMAFYCIFVRRVPRTTKYNLHITRCLLGLSSGLLLFYGLSKLPLNTATSITFTGPLFSTLAAIIFLREKTTIHRTIGLLVGFAGVLIILRPGTSDFDPNAMFLIITALIWGFTDITIKTLIKTDSIESLLFYMVVIMMIFSIPLGIYHWHLPTAKEAALCALLAAFHLGNFSTISKAFRHADISVLMPFEFFRLVFSSLFAYFLFAEHLDLWVLAGSLVILGSSIYVAVKGRK